MRFPRLALQRDESDVKNKGTSEELAEGASPILEGLRVLVVDDEADARELLSVVLKQAGGEIRVAATVPVALELLDQWQPHVLVSDIGMAGEDGYDLIKKSPNTESRTRWYGPRSGIDGLCE